MSLQTRSVPVEEVQKIQKSLWRQSSAVKDAIRDAAGRVLEHVRSRETFLLEQVELLERAKFEILMENLIRDGSDADTDSEMNEAIVEFASMELGVESGFRVLCDAIANFGPEMLKEGGLKKPLRKRHESVGSSLESDFCVLDDDSCLAQESPVATVLPPTKEAVEDIDAAENHEEARSQISSHFAVLENSPFSEWLLNEADDDDVDQRVVAFQSFFGEASRYALDYGFWLKEEEDDVEEIMEDDEEEEVDGWEKWLHPASSSAADAAQEAFFSDYMRFLRQSSAEDWMKDAPAPVSEIHIPSMALNRTEALTTSTSTTSIEPAVADGWLLKPRHGWHQNHPHHYGECADSCRALPDENAEMEIENIGDLVCLNESPKKTSAMMMADLEESLSQWILKPIKKGKAKGSIGRKNTTGSMMSDWLLEEKKSEETTTTTSTKALRSQSVIDEWLKSTEKELVKVLCKANEPCSGFSGCLSDINCKKGKSADDEEKEKEDENKEVESKGEKDSVMDDDSDEWVLPKKRTDDTPRPAVQEEKISQFMRTYHAMTEDFWLTS